MNNVNKVSGIEDIDPQEESWTAKTLFPSVWRLHNAENVGTATVQYKKNPCILNIRPYFRE